MKIYDEFGNVVNILPTYQQGGFILPQYRPSQVTLQTPSSEGLFRAIDSSTQNNWNRYVQGEQLNIQRARASQDFYTNVIDIQLKKQTQERVNKQLELQNKKFEYEIMKNNLDLINEGLAIGSEEFIEADRAAIDAQLNPAKDKLASTDYRNVDEVFKNRMEITRLKNTFTNGYANADRLKKGTTILNDTKNDKLLEFASKNNVLDTTVYGQYTNSKLEWAKALNEFNKTGDRSILDKAEEHRNNIETIQKFVDSDLFKQKIELANQTQQAEIQVQQAKAQEDIANAKMLTETLPSRIKLNEAKARLDIAKASSEISDEEFNQEQRKLQEADWKLWLSENPNPTSKERSNARISIFSDKISAAQGGYTSAEQMYAEGARTDDQELMDKALAWKTADNNKQTTVNYVTSNDGSTGEQNKDGSVNWGGHTIDKDGVTVTSVTVGNEPYTINTTGDDKGKVVGIPDAYLTKIGNKGYLKIKGDDGDNLEWVFGKYPGYGSWYTNDSLKDFSTSSAAPPGTKYEGGYLYIPQDDIKVTSTSGGSSYMGGQSTTPAPATSVGKNGMG